MALFAVILLCGSLHCDSLCVLFALCVLGSSRRVYPLANTEGSLDVSLVLTFASKLFERFQTLASNVVYIKKFELTFD